MMTLIEEKTLADHDINVKSIRQELQLLEKQLKKHGRNESQPSPTVTADSDTISRQDAINLIERYCDNGCEIAEYKWCPDCQQSKFAEMIKALPPSPSRPKGRWIPLFNGKFKGGAYWFKCSECERIVPEVRNGGWNYCPNCGADMRQ